MSEGKAGSDKNKEQHSESNIRKDPSDKRERTPDYSKERIEKKNISDGEEAEESNKKNRRNGKGGKKKKMDLKGSPSKDVDQDKKGKRSLRFNLPEVDSPAESFTSALSYNLGEEESEEYVQASEDLSVLRKFISPPLHHSIPRSASPKACFSEKFVEHGYKEADGFYVASASSSQQLFEILRNSPTPSDADLNLINSTYLRKLDGVMAAINNGADVNTFRDRQTPLLIATEIGDDRMVRYLLSVPNINPDFQNVFGQTPLIVAVKNNFDEIVKLLLNHNADVNIPDHLGKTPLHGALFQQRPEVARILLAYGANYEQADCFGETPMYTSAVKKPNLECLTTLLKVGASPECYNASGRTLLTRAILNWTDFVIIETLVKYGASVNARDLFTGKTPLHFAAMVNDVKIAEFLVQQGANVNVRTFYNFTPLDEALLYKSLSVAEYLMYLTKDGRLKSVHALRRSKTSK